MKPFISLCMIVKDEEKVLDRCLTSVENLVDEIIVVDTGSTDQTKEIAAKYTSKIYDFKWINDFSAARNFAASKANGKWILVLDADEYVDEQNFEEFIDKLKGDNGKYDCYSVKILNFSGDFGENTFQNHHGRVYKNNGKIQYYRNIHEQLISNEDKTLAMKNSSLIVFHSGYLSSTVREKDKNERNTNLINLELKNGGKNPFDYFNFGNEYGFIGDYEKALEFYLKAYRLKSDIRLSWVSHTVFQIINCLIKLERHDEALNVINDAKNMYPNSPEFPYLQGEVFLSRGQLDDAKQVYKQILNEQQRYNHIILRPDVKDLKPHIRLGEIFYIEENFNDSIYHYVSVLNINKYDSEAISTIIKIFNKFHTNEEISNFLKVNDLVREKNISIYVRACFNEGNPRLAIQLLNDYEEEHKLLTKVAQFKEIIIDNQGSIENIKEIFSPEVFTKLLESNWINITDLLLVDNLSIFDKSSIKIDFAFEKYKDFSMIKNLINGAESINNINKNIITCTVQQLILYRKYEICNSILENIEKADKNVIIDVARVLFTNGFKGEALQLYNLCDWDIFNEQDFINIISSLLQTNDVENAINVAQYANTIFKDDFRFYKFVLENTKNEQLFVNTLLLAREKFPDSIYLEKYF